MPGGVIVGDSGVCCCVPAFNVMYDINCSSAITSLCLLILQYNKHNILQNRTIQQHNTMQYNTKQHIAINAIQYNTIQCNAILYNKYNTIQYIQYNQYSTIQ